MSAGHFCGQATSIFLLKQVQSDAVGPATCHSSAIDRRVSSSLPPGLSMPTRQKRYHLKAPRHRRRGDGNDLARPRPQPSRNRKSRRHSRLWKWVAAVSSGLAASLLLLHLAQLPTEFRVVLLAVVLVGALIGYLTAIVNRA
jgi:hypothetical protein